VKLAKIAISPALGQGRLLHFSEMQILKISVSPRVMSQQLTASESKDEGKLYSDGGPNSIRDWGAGSTQSAVHFRHACVTRPNRSELLATADMRNRSASAVDQIDERLSFRFLNGAVDSQPS